MAGEPGDLGGGARSARAPARPRPRPPLTPRGFLLGAWQVERALEDAELGAGCFRGRAEFAPDGDDVRWIETGRLQLGRYAGPARRELRIVPAGPAWEVRFADGRPFHRLDLSAGACALHHPCGEDRYDGVLEVLGPDEFTLHWRVRGPRKAQRLAARYVRL